jgi:MFS family permease
MEARSPLAIRDYRAFWIAKLTGTLAQMMLVVVIGWQVYDIARQTRAPAEAAFVLGMVGLAQFLPLISLTLFVGYIADRVDRRWIARSSTTLEMACAGALAVLTLTGTMTLSSLFTIAALLGVARAFAGPSLTALAPNLVPKSLLPNAIAFNSIGWQVGAIGGPPLGGYLYAAGHAAPYLAGTLLFAISLVSLFVIRPVPRPERTGANPLRAVVEGLAYVRRNRIVLGSISLDLFAVLLGGATALLPVYARDILGVGAEGLGHLRSAPAVGAATVAILLARRPLRTGVGVKMFVAVGIFGAATIVFGLSRELWLSLVALGLLGAADMISVYVRQTLIQLHTPDEMRGRVAAVSGLFVSASNELGEFESGVVAAAMGPVTAVVMGGLGAIAVTLVWAWYFPELRRADKLGNDGAPA